MTQPTAKSASEVPAARQPIAWAEALIWFFRLMAFFQIAKTLFHWNVLLHMPDGILQPLTDQDMARRMATIYFSVIDPVAAVGLWMTSSWGAVLWLLAAASQVLILAGFSAIFGRIWPLFIFELMAISVYLWLSWQVANSARRNY